MSTIATLNVAVTADNQDFMNKMRKSADTTQEFSVSARGARLAVGQLGEAFGAQGQALGSIVQSFFALGPAVGAAVAGMVIFNKVLEEQKKEAQEATDFLENYAKVLHQVRESTGEEQAEGPFSTDATKKIDEINTQIDKLVKKQQEAGDSWFGGGGAIYTLERQIDKLREQEGILNDIRVATEKANDARKQFDESEYDNKVKNHGNKDALANGELDALQDYERGLLNTLRQLPEGGKEYLQVLKEYRTEHLKELELLDQIKDRSEKLAAEKEKEAKKFEEDIEKQFKSSVEAERREMEKLRNEAEKIGQSIETPSEKFVENIEKAAELFEKGLLSDETLSKYFDAQQKALEASSTHEVGSTSTFKQIDTSKISAVGLAKQNQKTTVHDEEATKAIKEGHERIVQAIREKNGNPATVAGG